jgi:hypothetical protein
MTSLYTNSLGKEVNRFSYSAGADFRYCPQRFHLKRRVGWREKIRRAAMLYGIAIENAVRYYHENEHKGGVKRFTDEWEKFRDDATVTYGKNDGDWSTMLACGQEHLALYDILLSTFPFRKGHKPKFQVPFTKEMFPNTELAGLELIAYVDMVTLHACGEPMIVDIKASSKRLSVVPGIVALDQQLRTYSFVSEFGGKQIELVAFLWFARQSRTIERGSNVRLLVDITRGDELIKAGTRCTIADVVEPDWGTTKDAKGKEKKNSAPEDYDGSRDTLVLVKDDTMYEEGKKLFPGQKKEEKELRAKYFAEKAIGIANRCDVTRQDIIFEMAKVSEADRLEAGTNVQYDIVAIRNAQAQNYFPKLGGCRYPNEKCPNCDVRTLCLGDTKLRDEMLVRTDEDWDTPQEGEIE